MRLFLCPNRFTDRQAEQAVNCISILEHTGGHRCSLSTADSLRLFGDDRYVKFPPAESDLMVSLGGDGSVLRAAKQALEADKPLLGINSGRLGYLCAMNFDQVPQFDRLFSECACSERTLLEFVYEDVVHRALNDVIIAKTNFGSTVDLSVHIDRESLIKVRGDGLIIATPTGSTAYNLSAGGPALDPESASVVLTPICPHSSRACPMVLSDRRTITVEERNNDAQVYADGNRIGDLTRGFAVRRSPKTLSILLHKDRLLNLP